MKPQFEPEIDQNDAPAVTAIQANVETAKDSGTVIQTSLPKFGLAGSATDRTLTSHGHPSLTPHPSKSIRPTVEGYELSELLGKGGEGEVWKAVRTDTGQELAVKVFNRSDYVGHDADFNNQRALAEHLAKQFSGDGSPFVSLSGAGHAQDGRPYIVMNLMDNDRVWKPSLRRMFTNEGATVQGKLQVDVKEYIAVFEETVRTSWFLAGVLNKMHGFGLVHRDIKPDNLVFGESTGTISFSKDRNKDFDGSGFDKEAAERDYNGEDEVEAHDFRRSKLLDTGIVARWRETPNSGHRMSADFRKFHASIPMVQREATDHVIGTPAFTPPEAFAGEGGPWSDQYSFALSMYEMLTGFNPRAKDTKDSHTKMPTLWEALPEEFLKKMKDPNFKVLGMPATSVVYLLSEIIEQGTELEYSKRHRDMGQMADLLSECVAQDEVVWATLPQSVRDMLKRQMKQSESAPSTETESVTFDEKVENAKQDVKLKTAVLQNAA